MSFPNQTTLKSAIADLKEVVTRLHGADTEPARLLRQIENCATEIEARCSAPLWAATQAIVNPAQALLNPAAQSLVNPIAQSLVNQTGQTVVNPAAQALIHPAAQAMVNPATPPIII
jgi:hypothetical protein